MAQTLAHSCRIGQPCSIGNSASTLRKVPLLPSLTVEQLVLLVGAFSALIGAITTAIVSVTKAAAEAARVRVEVEGMRRDLAKDSEAAEPQPTNDAPPAGPIRSKRYRDHRDQWARQYA